MKLLIQLTFNNGLGNLYCGAVELLNFTTFYKNLGYSCELIFASNGHTDNNKFIDYVDFEEIFDLNSFKIFDKISTLKNSISDEEYKEYKYHSTQYGPTQPGAHWWDVFFDEFPDEVYPKLAFNMSTLLNGEQISIFLPKLNKNIYKKVNQFLEKNNTILNAIQIRYKDYTLNPDDDFKIYCNDIKEKILNSPENFYFTSHNKYAIDLMSDLKNVVMYKYEHIDELPNDHSYYFYNKNFNRQVLLNRLYDNLAEMVLLSYFKKIYYSTSYPWISTFLYYAKSNNPKIELININNNLDILK